MGPSGGSINQTDVGAPVGRGLSAALFDGIPVPVAELGATGAVVHANPTFVEMVGGMPEGGAPSLADWLPPEDLRLAEEAVAFTLRYHRAPKPVLLRFRHPDGRFRWVQVAFADLEGAPSGRLLVLCTDLTAQHEREVELEHRAMHDPLTGLANRALAVDRIGHALRRVERELAGAAVLFIDLDGFKAVNDVHGHEVGDATLRAVAEALGRSTRARDTVARYGGDEFVVCVDDLPVEAIAAFHRVETLALRLLADIAAAGTAVDASHPVTASIGATLVLGTDPAARPADLVAEADAAAYAAKRAGGDRWAAIRHPRSVTAPRPS